VTGPGPLACPQCGTPAVPGARFCFHCGAPLDEPDQRVDAATERRIVTVLFGDLSDFTAWAEDQDPERVSVVTDKVLAALARAVTDVAGHVDKLTGDGIMAVFGAPTAHEDDPERAVRAAAHMQSAVRQLMEEEAGGGRRMGLRVGLNTGEVLAGVQAHLAYTVVGDTVNTAARLADSARIGSVLAGRETALATMSVASWRALQPLRLKGKREPVPAFELVGLRSRGSSRIGLGDEAPFVGRDAEFGFLVGRLMDAFDRGAPGSVLITGEAGVGKTRIAAELDRFAEELPDSRVLWGRCVPYGEGRHLAPLADWVRVACAVGDGDPPDEVAARVRRTVHRVLPEGADGVGPAALVDRLLALLGVPGGGSQQSGPREGVTPGTGRRAGDPISHAVAVLLDGLAAQGPLLLVVDDMQWAGREVLAAVARTAAQLAGPALLVCVGRGELTLPSDGDSDWWRPLPGVELLPLAPLDEHAMDRLLRSYLGDADLDPNARELLLSRSEGNPFFLAELLHLLVDQGLLRRMGTSWRLDRELPDSLLPLGVQSVLSARIDTLDPVAKSVLRDASVLGSPFGAAAFAALGWADEDELAAALNTLVTRGIVRPVSGAEQTYAFSHALVRDVAYASVPKGDRARRHADVAEWAAGSGAEVDRVVADHSWQAVRLAEEMQLPADDPAWRARVLGARAQSRMGVAALDRDDNAHADALLSAAVELGGTAAPRDLLDRILVARASARLSLHRLTETAADLARPLESADQPVRAAALVVKGELDRRRGRDRDAVAALVSAVALASDAGVDRVTGEALRQLGLIDYLSGRLPDAEVRFAQALDLADRVGDIRGVGWALQHLAWSETTRGDYAAAETTLARAAEVFAGHDDPGGLGWCAGTQAFVYLLAGRFAEARDVASGLVPMGEMVGAQWGVAACLTIDAIAAAELGQLSVARARADRAREQFASLGDLWGEAMALIGLGIAERGAARTDPAAALLEQALSRARRGRHRAVEALALSVLGFCRLDGGDAKAAESLAQDALALMAAMEPLPSARVGPQVLLAQAYAAQHRTEAAVQLLAEAVANARTASMMFSRRQALAGYAEVLLATGDAAAALRVAHDAMAAPAEDVRSRVVALRVLARCYHAVGDHEAARFAARQAFALARATEQVAERAASAQVLQDLG
jgi:class 3 adenylate cyclase/tetratricopeptide (TPR) repeat protein